MRCALRELAAIPALATVDAVGEAVLSESEADAYLARNLALLKALQQTGATRIFQALRAHAVV